MQSLKLNHMLDLTVSFYTTPQTTRLLRMGWVSLFFHIIWKLSIKRGCYGLNCVPPALPLPNTYVEALIPGISQRDYLEIVS